MALDIYWTVLLILVIAILVLICRTFALRFFKTRHARWRSDIATRAAYHPEEKLHQIEAASILTGSRTPETSPSAPPAPSTHALPSPTTHTNKVSSFRVTFLTIYLLAMTPETLAGPYLWSLLRDDKALSESTVAALFATAYTSAAVSALGVGFLADRFGRRKACLSQCGLHVAACLTVVFGGSCLPVLFVGRVLAGVGLTLLWTVFEVSSFLVASCKLHCDKKNWDVWVRRRASIISALPRNVSPRLSRHITLTAKTMDRAGWSLNGMLEAWKMMMAEV